MFPGRLRDRFIDFLGGDDIFRLHKIIFLLLGGSVWQKGFLYGCYRLLILILTTAFYIFVFWGLWHQSHPLNLTIFTTNFSLTATILVGLVKYIVFVSITWAVA